MPYSTLVRHCEASAHTGCGNPLPRPVMASRKRRIFLSVQLRGERSFASLRMTMRDGRCAGSPGGASPSPTVGTKVMHPLSPAPFPIVRRRRTPQFFIFHFSFFIPPRAAEGEVNCPDLPRGAREAGLGHVGPYGRDGRCAGCKIIRTKDAGRKKTGAP